MGHTLRAGSRAEQKWARIASPLLPCPDRHCERSEPTLATSRVAEIASSGVALLAMTRDRLQRLQFDLAEFHHALAVLQGDAALGVLAVGRAVDGLDAVERDVETRALDADLVGVPLAAGLEHGCGLGGVDDRTGAVARVRAGVEDVDLVGVIAGDLVGVGAADEDAAVGVVADP